MTEFETLEAFKAGVKTDYAHRRAHWPKDKRGRLTKAGEALALEFLCGVFSATNRAIGEDRRAQWAAAQAFLASVGRADEIMGIAPAA